MTRTEIEQQKRKPGDISQGWRLVERECTRTGLGRNFYPIECDLPNYRAARVKFEQLRGDR